MEAEQYNKNDYDEYAMIMITMSLMTMIIRLSNSLHIICRISLLAGCNGVNF